MKPIPFLRALTMRPAKAVMPGLPGVTTFDMLPRLTSELIVDYMAALDADAVRFSAYKRAERTPARERGASQSLPHLSVCHSIKSVPCRAVLCRRRAVHAFDSKASILHATLQVEPDPRPLATNLIVVARVCH